MNTRPDVIFVTSLTKSLSVTVFLVKLSGIFKQEQQEGQIIDHNIFLQYVANNFWLFIIDDICFESLFLLVPWKFHVSHHYHMTLNIEQQGTLAEALPSHPLQGEI